MRWQLQAAERLCDSKLRKICYEYARSCFVIIRDEFTPHRTDPCSCEQRADECTFINTRWVCMHAHTLSAALKIEYVAICLRPGRRHVTSPGSPIVAHAFVTPPLSARLCRTRSCARSRLNSNLYFYIAMHICGLLCARGVCVCMFY